MPKLIAPEVKRWLAMMAMDPKTRTWGPTQVHAALCEKFAQPDGDPISLRTVQKEWPLLRDSSPEWRLRPDDSDPAFTLQVLASMARLVEEDEFRPVLTIDQVDWLRVVHAARPDIDPNGALTVANLYIVAGKTNDLALARKVNVLLGEGGEGSETAREASDLLFEHLATTNRTRTGAAAESLGVFRVRRRRAAATGIEEGQG